MFVSLLIYARANHSVVDEVAYCAMGLRGVADLDNLAAGICACSTNVTVRYMLYRRLRTILESNGSFPSSPLDPFNAPTIQALLAYDPAGARDTPLRRFWRLYLIITLLDYKDKWYSPAWDLYLSHAATLAGSRGYMTNMVLDNLPVPLTHSAAADRSAVEATCRRRLFRLVVVNLSVHVVLAGIALSLMKFGADWEGDLLIFVVYLTMALILRLFLAPMCFSKCLDVVVKLAWMNSVDQLNSCVVALIVSPPAYTSAPEVSFAIALLCRSWKASHHRQDSKRPWILCIKSAQWKCIMMGPRYFLDGGLTKEVAFQNQIYMDFKTMMNDAGMRIP